MLLMRNVVAPESGVYRKEENTQVFIEQKHCGTGTLFVAESAVCWVGENGEGLSFDYPTICLHAVSHDTSSFPHPCIYMQVGLKLDTDDAIESEEDMAEDGDEGQEEDGTVPVPEEDLDPCTVVRLVPANTESLQPIFMAMSDCQQLHPDPDDSADSGNDEYFPGEGEGDATDMTPQGLITLQRLEGMLQQQHDAAGDATANGTVENDEEMEADEPEH